MSRTAVFIGRFQPFHLGHQISALEALASPGTEDIVFLIGSANKSRSAKNPFTYDERVKMISDAMRRRAKFRPLNDYLYDEARWEAQVKEIFNSLTNPYLVGYKKDSTSYYLDSLGLEHKPMTHMSYLLDATRIREEYLITGKISGVSSLVENFMENFSKKKVYQEIREEAKWVQSILAEGKLHKFPPQCVTVDTLCTSGNDVLLIQRGKHPGKGLWALPGGFVEPHKGDSWCNAVAELKEETRCPLSIKDLQGAFIRERRFDHPLRSQRPYILTTCFHLHFDLQFKVSHGDDAKWAEWVPRERVFNNPTDFHEDHWDIITTMLD